MAHRLRHSLLLLSLAALGALLLVPAGASAAACDWRDMIDAAANGRQISTHSTACYQRALSEVPADTDGYLPQVRANLVFAMRRDEGLANPPTSGIIRVPQSAAPEVAASVRGPVTDLLEGRSSRSAASPRCSCSPGSAPRSPVCAPRAARRAAPPPLPSGTRATRLVEPTRASSDAPATVPGVHWGETTLDLGSGA
jgi:hypothetical protein